MSRETATPAELVNLNAGFNPGTWVAGDTITSTTLDARPPAGRVWSVTWSAVFVTGNTISLTLDRSQARPEVTVSALTQAFSASSTATLEALRDQIRALAGVLWCTSSGGSSAPLLKIGFDEGYYGQVTGGTVTGGASQPTATLEETTPGTDVDGVTTAAVAIRANQALATLTDTGVTYTARRRYEGDRGNDISVEKVVSGTNTALSISVADLAITINVATNGGGSATTTATELVTALKNNPDAMNLISPSGSGATVQAALAVTNLSGGTDQTFDYRIWGFEQNLWRWVVVKDSEEAAADAHRGLRVNVANYIRLYCEITAVSGSGVQVAARIAGLEGGTT